jgi:hypothetical protein
MTREPAAGRDYLLHRELLIAIERARSQLAVAIATENKNTPRERWRHYLATEDRIRRCVKEIRCRRHPDPVCQRPWLQALHLLKQPLPEGNPHYGGTARELCQRLYDVLDIIEAGT